MAIAPISCSIITLENVPPGLNLGPISTPQSTDNPNPIYSASYLGWMPTPQTTQPNLKTYYFKVSVTSALEAATGITVYTDDADAESGIFVSIGTFPPGMGGNDAYYSVEYDQSDTSEVTIKIGGTSADDKANTKFKFTKGTAK